MASLQVRCNRSLVRIGTDTTVSLARAGQNRAAEQLLYLKQNSEAQLQASQHPTSRAHAALGDLIMHRAQFLFRERRYDDGKELVKLWKPVSESEYEMTVASNLRIESDKIDIAQGQMDEAVKHLREVAAAGKNSNPVIKQTDVNWATVLLCQVDCWQANYEQVEVDLQPRVQQLLRIGARADYITSDFRILLCESLLGLQRFRDAEMHVADLCTDLRRPDQIKNPRASDQLFQALCLKARCFQVQRRWHEAKSCWIDALEHEKVTKQMIQNGEIKSESYWVNLGVYSLGIVYYHLKREELGETYVSIAKERLSKHASKGDPGDPGEILDYTKWYRTLEDSDSTLQQSIPFGQRIKALLRGTKSMRLSE